MLIPTLSTDNDYVKGAMLKIDHTRVVFVNVTADLITEQAER